MTEIIVIGTGGFAREIAWLVAEINGTKSLHDKGNQQFHIKGCIGEEGGGTLSTGVGELPIVGNDAWALDHLPRDIRFVTGIGNPAIRKRIAEKFESAGFKPATLVHPSVRHSASAGWGEGSILCANSVLTVNIALGRHCVVNLSCTLGHDVRTGDFCNLSPGCHLSGNVSLGSGCEIGTGAVILPGISIGDETVVGAGAVVTQDLPPRIVAAGIPAKPIG